MTGRVVFVDVGATKDTTVHPEGFNIHEQCDAVERLLEHTEARLDVDITGLGTMFAEVMQRRGLQVNPYNESWDARGRIQRLRHAVAQAVEAMDSVGPSHMDRLVAELRRILEDDVIVFGGPR